MYSNLTKIEKYFKENLITQGNKETLNHVKLNTIFKNENISRIISTSAQDIIELRPKKQRINYLSTLKSLEKVEKVIENLAYQGKRFLFLSTNLFHRYLVEKESLKCSEYFVNKFWVKGTLSNWEETVKTFNKLSYLEKGEFPKHFFIFS
jgi:ribosomal protein S2